jgi:AcrR family transcriptional regulator
MEVKERIQQKAEELFHRYGIRSITMDEIATQLGISKKTIYQSFADKEELVLAVFDKHMSESKHRCVIDKQKADNAVHEIFLAFEMVEEMLKTMNPYILYDLEKYHPNVFRKFYEYKNEFLYRVVADNLKWGIKEELYRPEIDVEIMSRFRVGTLMIAFNTDVFPKGKFNPVDIELTVITHFLYGISTAKGVKLIQKYNQQRQKNKSLLV